MLMKRYGMAIVVLFISSLIGIGTILSYLLGIRMTPPGSVYIGATHYWFDYLFYVSQFMQGAHGRIIETSLYSEQPTVSIMAHWPNVLFGMLWHALGLAPIASYHVTVFVLICGIGLLSFALFRKRFPIPSLAFPAFLFFALSAPLMHRLPDTTPTVYYPFELWNTPHYIFSRFGPTPHTLMQTFLVIAILFVLFSKTKITAIGRIAVLCLLFLLMLIQPVIGLILLGTYWATVVFWRDDRDRWTTLFLTVLAAAVSIWTKRMVFSQEAYQYVQAWEAAQQVRTNLPFLLGSIGPIVPFAVVGMIARLRQAAPIERFSMFLVIAGYAAFLSPLPERLGISNARILSPAYFVGIAWFAAVGANTGAAILARITVLKKSLAMGMMLFLFLLSVAPTVIMEVRNKIPKPGAADSMVYLPASMNEAFAFLERTKPYDAVVLANPLSFMDARVPALSGHRTVNGTVFSPSEEKKHQEAVDIFMQRLSPADAKAWLDDHNVTYVLFTAYDGDVTVFRTSYPFLTPVFSTETATLFTVK